MHSSGLVSYYQPIPVFLHDSTLNSPIYLLTQVFHITLSSLNSLNDYITQKRNAYIFSLKEGYTVTVQLRKILVIISVRAYKF